MDRLKSSPRLMIVSDLDHTMVCFLSLILMMMLLLLLVVVYMADYVFLIAG